jgi:hypothetical protein
MKETKREQLPNPEIVTYAIGDLKVDTVFVGASDIISHRAAKTAVRPVTARKILNRLT